MKHPRLFSIRKFVVHSLLKALGHLPLWFHHMNAVWIGWLLEHVLRYRVDVVDDNLLHAFPQNSPQERLAIRHQFYQHFARIFTEAIWFGACTDPKRLSRQNIVQVLNADTFNEYHAKTNGTMILCAHSGNWELVGGILEYGPQHLSIDPEHVVVVYKKLSSAVFDAIMKENRCAPVLRYNFKGCLESGEVLRYALAHRNDKICYYFITDQHPYRNAAGFATVNFMNRECDTMTAAPILASKLSMSVLYLRMKEVSRGHYTHEYVPICVDASEMDPQQIMQTYYSLLEEDLKDQPYNYLWTHRRWKRVNQKAAATDSL